MTNEVQKNNEKMEVTYKVNGEPIRLTANMVQSFLANGNSRITQRETMMFLSLCKYQKLNPFTKDAYIIKFGNSPAQIIVSKEAFMKRAEANPNFDGLKAGCIATNVDSIDPRYTEGAFILPDETLLGGWAEIYRKDRKIPTRVEISLSEFQKMKNGHPSSTWASMPATMIRKTAIVNALREAFPNDLGAMQTEDDKEVEDETPKAVNKVPQQPTPATNINELTGSKQEAQEPAKKTAKVKKSIKDVTPKPQPIPQDELPKTSKRMSADDAKKAYEEIKNGGIDDDAETDKQPEQTEADGQTDLFDGE